MTDASMPSPTAPSPRPGRPVRRAAQGLLRAAARTVSTGDTPDAIIYLEMAWAYVMGHAELAHACSRQIAAHVEVGGTAAARKLV